MAGVRRVEFRPLLPSLRCFLFGAKIENVKQKEKKNRERERKAMIFLFFQLLIILSAVTL